MEQQKTRPVDVATFGESMALLSADTSGDLAEVVHFRRSLAGADSNVTIGLARLGLVVDWTSRVGDDAFGRFITAALSTEGIACDHITLDAKRPTGVQFKSHEIDGTDPTTLYLRAGSAASAISTHDLSAERLARARHLHVTGITAAISNSARALCHHAMESMRTNGGTISFDPNLRPSLWLDTATMRRELNALAAKADWVLPGIDEGEILTGSRQASEIAAFYLAAGASEVVVKLGADGAWWQNNDDHRHVAGYPLAHVVDTVGAGDAFAVGFISARLADQPPRQALIRGNAIAARVIGFSGDSEGLPDHDTLQELLETHDCPDP